MYVFVARLFAKLCEKSCCRSRTAKVFVYIVNQVFGREDVYLIVEVVFTIACRVIIVHKEQSYTVGILNNNHNGNLNSGGRDGSTMTDAFAFQGPEGWSKLFIYFDNVPRWSSCECERRINASNCTLLFLLYDDVAD